VAIARALVGSPEIVIADEPTANLDQETGRSVLDIMKKMNENYGTTFLFSTHSNLIMHQASRIIEIADGKIINQNQIQ
jgi:putative ABC transport system ATP-binding protein